MPQQLKQIIFRKSKLKIIINQYKSQPHMEDDEAGSLKTRDFICACGKNYLSYAALFTHIKQKHDGKAPGPIVRPRSQRKRGRPRKNPINDNDLRNSDSDVVKNGISIVNEINNNNINSFQKKTKQAAQLLGCGQFNAFQAYRPECQLGLKPKNSKQALKKPGFKRFVSQSQKTQQQFEKDEQLSKDDVPENLKHTKSAPAQNQEMNNAHSSYSYNFVIMHMKSLFKDYQPSEQQLSFRQIIEIYDLMSQEVNEPTNKKKQKSFIEPKNVLSVQKGLKLFLTQIQPHLSDFQYKQVSFILSLLYQYISQQVDKPSNLMALNLDISEVTNYLSSFISNWLPQKITELSISCLHICKDKNLVITLMTLCNWIALRYSHENYNPNLICYQQRTQNYSIVQGRGRGRQCGQQQINMQIQQKQYLQQSQEDLKFEELNHVLDQVRQARETKLKNQMSLPKYQTIESGGRFERIRISQEQQGGSQYDQQQSFQEYSQNSPQCLKGKHENQNKMIISQR